VVALNLIGYFENSHHLAAVHSASEHFKIETIKSSCAKGQDNFHQYMKNARH